MDTLINANIYEKLMWNITKEKTLKDEEEKYKALFGEK